jgi:hypothetical protein
MRAIFRLMVLTGLAGAAACSKGQPPQDQNITIADNNMAGADIETLPSDESSGTPSNQLVNGNDNPDVNDATVNSD